MAKTPQLDLPAGSARSRPGSRSSCTKAQEVVIAGWRAGQGRRDGGVGSLLMGVPTPDGLRYRRPGRLGFQRPPARRDRGTLLQPLARKTSPLIDVPREDARDAHWVTPSLVGEVTYGELTEPGRLRHPVWRGLRPDKSPADVQWELLVVTLGSGDAQLAARTPRYR